MSVMYARATNEAATANRVQASLESIFTEIGFGAASDNVTVRELLDKGAERAVRELEHVPEAKARLMNTIATTYLKLGLHKQAASWWRRAIDLRRTVLRNDDVALATSHASLAHALERDGRYAEADGHFRTALSTLRRVSPRPDREFVDVLIQYGGYRQNIGEYGAGGSCNRSRTLSPSGVRERRRVDRTAGRTRPWRGYWRANVTTVARGVGAQTVSASRLGTPHFAASPSARRFFRGFPLFY